MKQARRPGLIIHHSRPKNNGGNATMESYRNQIIAMLDTITDANLMRFIHDAVKLIMMHR